MSATETWEVIVWDGTSWFRPDPPVTFETRKEAEDAVQGLRGLAPARILTSGEIASFGLPKAPPSSEVRR